AAFLLSRPETGVFMTFYEFVNGGELPPPTIGITTALFPVVSFAVIDRYPLLRLPREATD
ncbi:MAG: hypothetical protein QMD32_06310, partial [Smithellaceae bacterium]|nr:hypothetical protein [Smithellaceae bacterium]